MPGPKRNLLNDIGQDDNGGMEMKAAEDAITVVTEKR